MYHAVGDARARRRGARHGPQTGPARAARPGAGPGAGAGYLPGRLWAPETLSPYATWVYSWIRPSSRSRRRTRPAVPSPTRGYIRGIQQVDRSSSGQHHFAASRAAGIPVWHWRGSRIVSAGHVNPGPGSSLSRNLHQVR